MQRSSCILQSSALIHCVLVLDVRRSLRNFTIKVYTRLITRCCKRRLRVLQPSFWNRRVVMLWWCSHYWISSAKRWVSLLCNTIRTSRGLVCFLKNFIARQTALLKFSSKCASRCCVHVLWIHVLVVRVYLSKLLSVVCCMTCLSFNRLHTRKLPLTVS